MTADIEMKLDYVMVLKNLEAELDGIEPYRQKLIAAIASMSALVGEAEQHRLNLGDQSALPDSAGSNGSGPRHAIPAGFFAGKTPTQAYRDLVSLWPAERTPPQITDALLAGGMTVKTRTQLLQAIHSVLKREQEKARKGD